VLQTVSVAERRSRLARRHFLSPDRGGEHVTDIIGALIGLHATDPATPYLSLWSRRDGFAVNDLDHELYQRRSLVKHLAMRRTLWVVRADDLVTIQPGASDRVADNERRRLVADAQKAGVATDGEQWLERAGAAVLRYLAEHGAAGAAELRTALPELAGTWDPAPGKRWGGETPLAPRILTALSVRGDIVRGPNDGAWTISRPRWTATADWLGAAPDNIPAEKARAELVRAWLRAFGPGTPADIKWWLGSTLTVVRQALRELDAIEVDLDGTIGYVLPDDVEPEAEGQPWGALLPGLDVTTMGWSERDWYLGEHRSRVFDTNGNAGPTAWWNGRVVGGWSQDADGRVQVQLLEDPGRDGRRALSRRADELTAWLDGVRISPRFPSPLSKTR
jgi:hypothetical protein